MCCEHATFCVEVFMRHMYIFILSSEKGQLEHAENFQGTGLVCMLLCMGFPDHTDGIQIQSEMKAPELPTCVIDESCVMSLSAFGDMDS